MIPFQIPRKLDPVLYVWINYKSEGGEDEVIAGLNYYHHISQVIGDGLLHSTLPYYYRGSPRGFQMMATEYVADIKRENSGYIYNQLYTQVWPPHEEEYILSQRVRHWSRD